MTGPVTDLSHFRPPLVRRDSLWVAYLSVGVLIMGLYAFVPPFKGNGPLINALGLSSSVAIALGIRIHRPRAARAWWLFVAGQFMFFAGDLYTYSYPKLLGVDVPFPSPGDVAYLTVYPVLLVGLVMMIKSRSPRGDRGSVIDSMILTLGFALLSWVFLIMPYGDVSGISTLAKGVSVAYPLGDVLLLAGAIRLAVDAGRRPPAFFLLIGSIVCLLSTDSVYTYMLLNNLYHGQIVLDIGWMSYYLLWGAAALHPSMVQLSEPVERSVMGLSRRRFALLATACLIAPLVRFAANFHHPAIAMIQVAAAALFLLVLSRMVGMVKREERSTVLRSAGVELVGAASREQIHQAVTAAVAALTRVEAETRLVLTSEQDAMIVGVDSEASPCSREATAWLGAHLGQQVEFAMAALPHPMLAEFGLEHSTHVFSASLCVRGITIGALIVGTPAQLPREAVETLDALAAQVALALEGAVTAETVHRRQSEARFRSLVAHATDLITVLDEEGLIVYQSPSITSILGRTAEQVEGTSFVNLVRESDRPRLLQLVEPGGQWGAERRVIECSLERADGSWLEFEVQATNLLHDEHLRGIVLNSRDVSERKAFEEQLSHQAFHDPVTGLANRALFSDRVTHALGRRSHGDLTVGLMFIDLDDFKTINDSLGHAAGDELLRQVAKRLCEVVRPIDTVARFGGDEFAILLEDVLGVQQAADLAERVLASLEETVRIDDKDAYAHASIGICLAGEDASGKDANELLRNADVAMYMAKRNSKGSYRVFEPAMHERVLERLELRADLQNAIEDGQLEVHYQPVMRIKNDAVYGVEALLRWTHPTRGPISPAQFIPLAEETGLIISIGRWVLQEACREAKRIDEYFSGTDAIIICVNLSVKQLQDENIVEDVRAALRTADLDPSRLVLEITESVMIADAELAIERLLALKQIGVRLAMDDFGTGYSSLSHLSRLPVDILKMDRSFLSSDKVDSGLAAAIVGLGATLNMDIVAEGIEVDSQNESLRDLGCELGQGFLFAKPMHPDALRLYLETHGILEPPEEEAA
jgi:diguanylate cyclase (GGDEF)-like protein/PAS domain S-box-containing protein